MGFSALDLREICDLVHHRADARQEAQPGLAQTFLHTVNDYRLVGVNGNPIEEFIDPSPQSGEPSHSTLKDSSFEQRRQVSIEAKSWASSLISAASRSGRKSRTGS